jgi:phage-related protein
MQKLGGVYSMYVSFKNTDLSKLRCTLIDPFPKIRTPKKISENFLILGNNTVFTSSINTYEPYNLFLNFMCDRQKKIDDIKILMQGNGDLKIDKIDRAYISQVVEVSPFTKTKDLYLFYVEFLVEPLLKKASKDKIITIDANNKKINNLGTTECKPTLKIFGNGTCNIQLNGQYVTINNVVNFVTIDNLIVDVFKDNQSFNNNTIGNLPLILKIGKNTCDFSGGVTKIEVTKNERWL